MMIAISHLPFIKASQGIHSTSHFNRFLVKIKPVGCIYASKPFNSSLIYYQHLFSLQFYYQTSKSTEIYFFYFSCIFTDIIFVSFVFSMLLIVWRFVSFAFIATFDSGSRKHLPTHWLYLTIWPPDGKGIKVPGKQVYASETHSRTSSLLSVYHHWGGEQQCHCNIYLLIFIVACYLGSIYSHIECIPPLRSL